MEDLKVGDVVKITTKEGPKMTVDSISGFSYECVWFDGHNLYRDFFNKTSLVKLEE